MDTMHRPDPLLDSRGRPAREIWTLRSGRLHLNHGSFGAVPSEVQAVQTDLAVAMDVEPNTWFRELPSRIGEARRRVAAFIGADEAATALVPNASAGVSVVLSAAAVGIGDEILLTDHGYGAVQMAAERAARRVGATTRIVHLPLEAGADAVVDAITSAIGDRTVLLIVDQITSATARLLPIGAIAEACRARGVRTLIDAAHAPGMLERPLDGVDADWWVGNLHKWACAPRGTAALVTRAEHRDVMYPLIDSWGAPDPYPERFDTQGTIDARSYLAAPESFAVIEREFGWRRAREYMTALADYAQRIVGDALEATTGTPAGTGVGMPAPSMRLVALPDGLVATPDDARTVGHRLADEHGAETAITCWNGRGFLRLSAHVYNTAEDFERFAEDVVPALARIPTAA